MSGIQVHHAKLWLAGQNQNWPLAGFEIHEIQEAIDDIKNYCSEREETKSIGIINGPVDSLTNAVSEKNIVRFQNSFTLLTNTCNDCHKITKHEFNIVTIPVSSPGCKPGFQTCSLILNA